MKLLSRFDDAVGGGEEGYCTYIKDAHYHGRYSSKAPRAESASMALRYLHYDYHILLQVSLCLAVAVVADQTSHVSISLGGAPAVSHHSSSHHGRTSYHHQPTYHTRSSYHPQPSYHPAPAYHPQPSYEHEHEPAVPECAANTTKSWCLEDDHYPTYEIKHAAEYHYEKLLSLYADVADLNTELSVDRPNSLDEETYLCPSETAYIRPLRAQNTEGKWRVVVNNIDAHYQTFTQTTRIEECLTSGDACPLVPECYESKCLQKSIYHRFLVYDSYDQYFPFAIETFKLPASCACLLGAYTIDH
ncbi:protein spaetzle-like [Penaeus indicus]|uniref:protein spaetzle-like n=1 Tax=Penaeus indicus TaxID=29960 RepID=UPI00300C0153